MKALLDTVSMLAVALTGKQQPQRGVCGVGSLQRALAVVAVRFKQSVPNTKQWRSKMQAAKVEIGKVYAVRGPDDKLLRFKVQKIVTVRTRNGPGGTESSVSGYYDEPGEQGKVVTHGTSALLGPYTEHVELAARAKAEQEETERKRLEANDRRKRAAQMLANALGVSVGKNYEHNTVRALYSDITIPEAMVPTLIALGERLCWSDQETEAK